VLNTPATYPVKRLKGGMIAGPPIVSQRDLNGFAWPPSLQARLVGYRVEPRNPWTLGRAAVLQEVHAITEHKCRLALELLRSEPWITFSSLSSSMIP